MIFLAKGIQDILFWYLQYNFFSFCYCSVFYWMHTCSWYIFGLFDLFRITLSKDITVNLIFHVYFSLNMHMEDLYRFCTKVEKPLHQKLLHIKFIQKYQTFFQGNCPSLCSHQEGISMWHCIICSRLKTINFYDCNCKD